MKNFKEFMIQDHRDCDSVFSDAEKLVESGDWSGAKEAFLVFKKDMLTHFGMEEEIIFPEFNQKSGGGCNPTGVMLMEHDQMKRLLGILESKIDAQDKDSFFGSSDTLMMVLQQHNLKEEQIMYNLALDALSGEQGEILQRVQAYKSGK